jgi:hypothetical protein
MLAQLTQHAAPILAESLDEAVAAVTSTATTTWPPALARPGRYICDVGGGGGGGKGLSPLLTAVLARHPGAKGMVYDLAEAARDDALPPEFEPDDVEAREAEAAVPLVRTSLLEGGVGAVWPALAKRGTSLADARRRIKRVSGSFLNRDEVVSKLGGGRVDLFLLKVR